MTLRNLEELRADIETEIPGILARGDAFTTEVLRSLGITGSNSRIDLVCTQIRRDRPEIKSRRRISDDDLLAAITAARPKILATGRKVTYLAVKQAGIAGSCARIQRMIRIVEMVARDASEDLTDTMQESRKAGERTRTRSACSRSRGPDEKPKRSLRELTCTERMKREYFLAARPFDRLRPKAKQSKGEVTTTSEPPSEPA